MWGILILYFENSTFGLMVGLETWWVGLGRVTKIRPVDNFVTDQVLYDT